MARDPISAIALSDLIGSIYDCALDPGRWPATLAMIREALNFQNAMLALQALPTGKHLLYLTSGIEPQWLDRMLMSGSDVLAQWGGEAAINRVAMDEPALLSRVNPAARAAGSAYRYHLEWAKPQGLIDTMAIILTRDSASIGSVGFGRHESAGPIGEREIAMSRLLIPHLQRATMISRLIDIKTVAASTFEAVIDALVAPVVLTGADLAIVHANSAAHAMFARGDILRSRANMISPCSRGVAAALSVAVTQAGLNEGALGRKGLNIPARTLDGEACVLHILPLCFGAFRPGIAPGAVAAIFVAPRVSASAAPKEVLSALFSLTAAETRVFAHIAAGRTSAETADTLGVGLSTVKTHLLRLFDKTGVHRQADLVALAASFALPVGG